MRVSGVGLHTGARVTAASVRVSGVGLHTGASVTSVLTRRSGPLTLAQGEVEAQLSDLEVASTVRATTVVARRGLLRVQTVEHALAALAALGHTHGLTIRLDGPEMPLLDGGAATWCAALRQLDAPVSEPSVRIARHAVIRVGSSHYTFTPGDAVAVTVRVVFETPWYEAQAQWDGDRDDFCTRIAPARTFALSAEIDDLTARGLVRHVDPDAVMVLGHDGALCARGPARADEPARHKLLDLLGDLYLYGGPALGHIHAIRPGHTANHRAFEQARADGVLRPIA